MKFPFRLLTLMAVGALLLSACAVASRNALIGKWGNTEQDIVLEFTMDGRMRQTSQGVTQELGYQFTDDQSFVLKSPASTADPQPIAFKINGNTLTLDLGADTSGQKQTMDFQRVK